MAAAASTAGVDAPGLDFLDQKVVRAPPQFSGDKTKWKHFNRKLLSFVGGLSVPLKEMMKVVPTLKKPLNHAELGMSAEQIALDSKLYTMLSSLLEDDAMDVLCNVDEGEGLEVYRLLARHCDPKARVTHRVRLIKVMEPEAEVLTGSYFSRLQKWEQVVKEYQRTAGKIVDDDMKMSVLHYKLAPQELV